MEMKMTIMRETAQLSETEPVCVTIVNAVATVTDTHPQELPALYNVVDVDALTALVAPSRKQFASDVTIQFKMVGCTVTVSSEGTVTVTDGDETLVETHDYTPSTHQSDTGVMSE